MVDHAEAPRAERARDVGANVSSTIAASARGAIETDAVIDTKHRSALERGTRDQCSAARRCGTSVVARGVYALTTEATVVSSVSDGVENSMARSRPSPTSRC